MTMVDRFNHIGLCVNDADKTFEWLQKTMGASLVFRKVDEKLHQITLMAVLPDGISRFELMQPLSEDSTPGAFIKKKGEGIHHVSLFTHDVEGSAAAFEAEGCKVISRDKGLIFLHPKTTGGVLYELSDGTYGKEE